MDLPEFLLARIAEDEEAARAVAESDGAHWTAATDVGDDYNVAVVTPSAPGELQHAGWRDALLVSPSDVQVARCGVDGLESGELRTEHIARQDPARVLAECAAKRAVVELHTGNHECPAWWTQTADDVVDGEPRSTYTTYVHPDFVHASDPTLMALAQPHASHPDFDPAWRV